MKIWWKAQLIFKFVIKFIENKNIFFQFYEASVIIFDNHLFLFLYKFLKQIFNNKTGKMSLDIKNLSHIEQDVGQHIKSTKKHFIWEFLLDGKSHKIELYDSRLSGKKKLI